VCHSQRRGRAVVCGFHKLVKREEEKINPLITSLSGFESGIFIFQVRCTEDVIICMLIVS
jgi:hypothetical protein